MFWALATVAQLHDVPTKKFVQTPNRKGGDLMVQKKSKVLVSENAKSEGVSIPQILASARVESLNHIFTLKLWPSVATYIEAHGGADFVRTSIIEKLERLVDKTVKARCDQCVNLGERDGQPFCLWMCATFLPEDQKRLNELFSCDGWWKRPATSLSCALIKRKLRTRSPKTAPCSSLREPSST